jgi:hypothetical protein
MTKKVLLANLGQLSAARQKLAVSADGLLRKMLPLLTICWNLLSVARGANKGEQ